MTPPPLPLRKKQFPTSGGNKVTVEAVYLILKKTPAEISTKELHLDTISVKLSPEYSEILKAFQVHEIAMLCYEIVDILYMFFTNLLKLFAPSVSIRRQKRRYFCNSIKFSQTLTFF